MSVTLLYLYKILGIFSNNGLPNILWIFYLVGRNRNKSQPCVMPGTVIILFDGSFPGLGYFPYILMISILSTLKGPSTDLPGSLYSFLLSGILSHEHELPWRLWTLSSRLPNLGSLPGSLQFPLPVPVLRNSHKAVNPSCFPSLRDCFPSIFEF